MRKNRPERLAAEAELIRTRTSKVCIHCQTDKELFHFALRRASKDLLDSACRPCRRKVQEARAHRSLETTLIDGVTEKICSRCTTTKSLDAFSPSRGRYCRSSICKECIQKWAQEYYLENKQHILKRGNRWKKDNPDKCKVITARSRAKQRKNLQWHVDRRVLRKVDRYAKHGISRVMRSDTEYAVGWTFDQLRTHIESLFVDGMSWTWS